MNFTKLEKIKLIYLQNFATDIGIQNSDIDSKNRNELINNIYYYLKKYRNCCSPIIKKNVTFKNKYTKIKQLFEPGKEGTAYLVSNSANSCNYAMKMFRKNKSETNILKEAELQKLAANVGISPMVIDVNVHEKYIVMEQMDTHLLDIMKKQDKDLKVGQQRQIIDIFKKLDECKVFHNDSNILNYMFKNKKLYIIDFGMSKAIDDKLIKKLNTDKPNMTLMLIGFIMKLKELGCPQTSYSYLIRFLDKKYIERFNLL
uniref:non-specific serine/threonine protein kinase n=1 Tax=viral metagenome TaxID=1070528 RepID=A0A6C0D097_9ZZZZ